jgi:hypothetical protein
MVVKWSVHMRLGLGGGGGGGEGEHSVASTMTPLLLSLNSTTFFRKRSEESVVYQS